MSTVQIENFRRWSGRFLVSPGMKRKGEGGVIVSYQGLRWKVLQEIEYQVKKHSDTESTPIYKSDRFVSEAINDGDYFSFILFQTTIIIESFSTGLSTSMVPEIGDTRLELDSLHTGTANANEKQIKLVISSNVHDINI